MVLPQEQKDPWDRIEIQEINPCTYGQLICDKRGKNIQWRKGSLFSNGAVMVNQVIASVK